MTPPLCHRLLRSTICFFLPTLLLSQVIIREKVEIKPSQPSASVRNSISSIQTADYFNPPMFITDSDGTPVLTLPSNLTITGQVNILGAIGGNQRGTVALILGANEREIAWKGRYPISWGGEMYEGEDPYTGVFDKGGSPNLQLYVFDGQWGTGARERSITGGGLSFSFTSYLNQGTLPRVDVTATATVAGSILTDALFDHWEIRTHPVVITCGGKSRINFLPFDAARRLYQPYGIPPYDTYVTVSVEAKGDYAYLRCGDQEGQQVTISLLEENPLDLWLDTGRGEIPGEQDSAIVRVSGGGRTGKALVVLVCEKLHHFRITADPEAIDHGSSSALTVIAEDVNGQEVVPESEFDVTFRLSSPNVIEGSRKDTSQRSGTLPPIGRLTKARNTTLNKSSVKLDDDEPLYGSFVVDGGSSQEYTVTVPYSLARQERVNYLANGQIPFGEEAEPVTVTVERASDGSKSASLNITVRPVVCAKVLFDPPTVGPGDTTQLSFTKIVDEGAPEDFPADQTFNVTILSGGGDNGVLISGSGETGTTLAAVRTPIWYVAPDSIEGDTLVVKIVATASGGSGGIAASIQARVQEKDVVPGTSRMDMARTRPVAQESNLEQIRAMLLARAAEACVISEIVVTGSPIDHFTVTVSPDTVEQTMTAIVKIQAKDKESNDLRAAANTKLNVVLTSDEKYGSLSHQGNKGKALLAIPYKDANLSIVSFLADGDNPIGLPPQKVPIGVTQAQHENVSGTGLAIVKCHVQPPHFRQGAGSTWGQQTYDHSSLTIADLGCALSCMAMSMTAFGDTIDPGALNTWMKNRNRVSGGFEAAKVNWEAMSKHSSEMNILVSDAVNVSRTFDVSELDEHLLRCELIIAKVYNQESVRNKSREEQEETERNGNHWVLLVGRHGDSISIRDPGRGLGTLSEYGRIYRYIRVYK
jgi:hypothetical protein